MKTSSLNKWSSPNINSPVAEPTPTTSLLPAVCALPAEVGKRKPKAELTMRGKVEYRLLDSTERLRASAGGPELPPDEKGVLGAPKGAGLTPQGGAEHAPLASLTPRERQIAALIAEANSNKQVAALLNISIKTVETHRSNLMAKLGLHSVSELVRFAIRIRLVEP
jgi:DNA-binding CsgD family transcriptional regulator